MKTKKYFKLALVFILIFNLQSCEMSDFGDMNIDKKSPSKAVPSYMLTGALRSIPTRLMWGARQPAEWMQYFSEVIYISNEQYNTSFVVEFPFYQNPLVDLQYIIDINSDPAQKDAFSSYGDNVNQIAVARILKAFYFQAIADQWGSCPYFDALKGAQGGANLRPKLDQVKDIYPDLFKELTEAVAQINEAPKSALQGDFLFNGNMKRWKMFANTMHLVMAMRISNVDPIQGKAELLNAISASGGIIGSNADNLKYPFLDDALAQNYSPFYSWFSGSSYNDANNKTFVDMQVSINDPRLPYFNDKAVASNTYVGKPAGIISEASLWSKLGVNFRTKTQPLYIYSYSQVLFTLAEASHRGWITTSTADAYYNDAIKASLEQYTVYNAASYTTYINQPAVKWDAANAYALLGNQKWIAMYPYGVEAWCEWRRLGYPLLLPTIGAQTADMQIPRRCTYGINTKTLMPDQFAASELIFPDKNSTHIWWDVPVTK